MPVDQEKEDSPFSAFDMAMASIGVPVSVVLTKRRYSPASLPGVPTPNSAPTSRSRTRQ